jgi:hypothetical protein
MEVNIQNTKADYEKVFRLFYFQKFKKASAILLSVFTMVCLYNMAITLAQSLFWWQIIFLVITAFVSILGILYILGWLAYNMKLSKMISKQPSMLNKKFITLSENEFRIENGSEVVILKHGDINLLLKNNHLIHFITNSNKGEIIPTRFFKSKNEAEIFFKIIQIKILKK